MLFSNTVCKSQLKRNENVSSFSVPLQLQREMGLACLVKSYVMETQSEISSLRKKEAWVI